MFEILEFKHFDRAGEKNSTTMANFKAAIMVVLV